MTKMNTYEIKRSELDGMSVVATGYKAVSYNNGTLQSFRYGEKGESLIGRIFKVDGVLSKCEWGLHFSKDPANVFNFYQSLGYNKYFKVNAYGKVIDGDVKSVAQIIEFVEEYDVMEYIKIIKDYDRSANAVNCSYAVSRSYGVRKCSAIKCCLFCYDIECTKYALFNRKITPERFDEVNSKILSFGYTPSFNNFYDLKGDKEWWSIAFPELMTVDNKTAWSKMPQKMVEYIKSLPEYDEEIFKAITE